NRSWGLRKSRTREGAARIAPTGAHGLVARPYEPLADNPAGTQGPTKPVFCSRFKRHIKADLGFDLASGPRWSGHGQSPRRSTRKTDQKSNLIKCGRFT